jgi:hypothetical protein
LLIACCFSQTTKSNSDSFLKVNATSLFNQKVITVKATSIACFTLLPIQLSQLKYHSTVSIAHFVTCLNESRAGFTMFFNLPNTILTDSTATLMLYARLFTRSCIHRKFD